MQDVFTWLRGHPSQVQSPWLILGKGDSYAGFASYDTSGYRLLSLNHVVRDRRVDIAHAIDLDVVLDCAEAIEANAGVLVMPWVPHQKFRPGRQNLGELAETVPVLAKLAAEGRLLFYNAATAPRDRNVPGVPVVPVTYFSAEAALALLVMGGVRTIRSLGVDGGTSYAPQFSDLEGTTKLANTQSSFDKQFAEFAKILQMADVDFAPLNLQHPVRVFVGSEAEQGLATQVLAHTIRRHASISVDVRPIDSFGLSIPMPSSAANAGKTPFSFQRFLIPEICAFQGRAIYVDSDMMVFKDIRQLWASDFGNAQILSVQPRDGSGRAPQHSVLLLECSRLSWKIRDIVDRLDSNELAYHDIMSDLCISNDPPVRAIGSEWNSLEYFRKGTTALLHFTDMTEQPWVSHRNPLGYLWFEALFDAVDSGAIAQRDVDNAIAKGHVRPTVGYQLANRIADGRRLPARALDADRNFIAPYQRLTGNLAPGAHLHAGLIGRIRRKLSSYVR